MSSRAFRVGWHGVVTTETPRVASQDALDRKPATPENTVSGNGFDCVRGAAGMIATTGWEVWTEAQLIAADRHD